LLFGFENDLFEVLTTRAAGAYIHANVESPQG
jgi:hypothetical protein